MTESINIAETEDLKFLGVLPASERPELVVKVIEDETKIGGYAFRLIEQCENDWRYAHGLYDGIISKNYVEIYLNSETREELFWLCIDAIFNKHQISYEEAKKMFSAGAFRKYKNSNGLRIVELTKKKKEEIINDNEKLITERILLTQTSN